jgi:iron(III) transport system ATP-binding protein
MNALEVRGLRVSYGDHTVLRGVDLTVHDGVTAIVGSSGCGKTTLLRSVAGLVEPSEGTIAVAGTPVLGGARTVPPRRRGLGYVPQEGALFPHLSVVANIGFGLPRGERRTSARITAMLDLVELSRTMADRFPHELSGGQQQRVALARALAPRPALVLLDEPFASLDAGLREETGRSVVRALRAAGAAALLVTHDQGEALSLADQVAVMSDGAFLQVAPPSQVYLAPSDSRVAAFLGHATLLPGHASSRAEVECALGTLPLREKVDTGPVIVAVRAEQVQVRPNGAPGTRAEVLDVSFFGHDATVRVRLASGEEVAARTPAGGVPAAGDAVSVQVIGDVVAFSNEQAP